MPKIFAREKKDPRSAAWAPPRATTQMAFTSQSSDAARAGSGHRADESAEEEEAIEAGPDVTSNPGTRWLGAKPAPAEWTLCRSEWMLASGAGACWGKADHASAPNPGRWRFVQECLISSTGGRSMSRAPAATLVHRPVRVDQHKPFLRDAFLVLLRFTPCLSKTPAATGEHWTKQLPRPCPPANRRQRP